VSESRREDCHFSVAANQIGLGGVSVASTFCTIPNFRSVHLRRLRAQTAPPRNDVPKPVPRISRLMALAIRFDQLIRDGVVADQAELARLGHVTGARMTQIMNPLNLAPDIQEEILFLPPKERERDCITERDVRPMVAVIDWGRQRQLIQIMLSR
jgi:hypothetical protein